MTITFNKLESAHFPLLLKWLMTPHVRQWWDTNIEWTPTLIAEKYGQYINGYKRLHLASGVIEKPMHAYVIVSDGEEIGYMQYYNKHDFPSEYGYEIDYFPENLAAIDWYIGEPDYLRQGLGTKALNQFIADYVFKDFEAAFVDPDVKNIAAIRTYERCGFQTTKQISDITWMLKHKNSPEHP
jgi:aminoglycoside 6'-N-acetyltransferase